MADGEVTTPARGWRQAVAGATRRLLDDLNPSQREAVTHPGGPLLVVAGPGSGKTRTLTHRLAYLILNGVHPRRLLAVTFTNKAAGEMRQRVEALVGPVARDMWLSTFHSACVRLLRRDVERLGYRSNFVILDEDDRLVVVREALCRLGIDEDRLHPVVARAAISRAKDELLGPEEVAAAARGEFETRLAEVYRVYQARLRESDALDFDDLIRLAVLLLREYPAVLEYYRDRFQHVLVDEYQDTNHAQYVLVRLLAGGHRNLTVVGDPDQSIYGFRGATIRNIVEFEKDFPAARVIRLETNYRSTQPILDVAQHLVRHNRNRKEKELHAVAGAGASPRYYQAWDERDEARFVARTALALYGDGVPLREMAVLYRTHAQSRVVEEAFLEANVPYAIVGGLKFYQRKEVKDVLAYLRLVANPADRLSLRRVINVPRRGVGEGSLARIEAFLDQTGLDAASGLRLAHQIPGLTRKAAGALAELGELLASLHLAAGERSLTDLAETVMKDTGYLRGLEAQRTVGAQARVENLGEFLSLAAEFDRRWRSEERPAGDGSRPSALAEFLAEVALVSDADTYQDELDAIVLMTLHSAKGLEFTAVFLVGLEEGLFPHSRSMDDPGELEEERRLAYVGITRAKRFLYLTHARRRTIFGASRATEASRFLNEIPPSLLEEIAPASPPGWNAAGRELPGLAGTAGGQEPRARSATHRYAAGDRVLHRYWGAGKVRAVRDLGDDTELTIEFPGYGTRTVLVSYAPLEPI